MRIKYLIPALLFVTASLSKAQEAELPKNITIKPATLSVALNSGESESKKITISNQTDTKLQFRVYLNDWVRDSIGGHKYYKPDTLSVSCSKWISFDKSFIEVGAKSVGEINVNIKAPAGDSLYKMLWSMIFIETIEEKKAPQNDKGITSIVNNKMRIGVHVYETPPALTKKEMQLVSFLPVKDSVNQYKVICKNTGDIQVQTKMYIELSSLKDGKKTTVDGRVFPTFPDQLREFTFTLPSDLPKGKYNAVAVVDAGDDVPLEAAQAIIDVK